MNGVCAWWEAACALFFPSHCPVCGAYVTRRGGWCAPCLDATCRVRRIPLDDAARAVIDAAWAIAAYHPTLRPLLHALKFRGRTDGLPYMETLLHASFETLQVSLQTPAFAVPVPLAPARQKSRGFNQAERIFSTYLTARGWTWSRALVRTRETVPQYGLDRAARVANVKDAFAVSQDMHVFGARVLLVDDILTTGATAVACAKALRAAGVRRIDVLVLASDA